MKMGPKMGRRAGYCGGYDAPEYAGPIRGRAYDMPRGEWRRGWSDIRGVHDGRRFGAGRAWSIHYHHKEVSRMPRGDRTGPRGMGPMTGRGFGYCGGYDAPEYANPGPGCGYGYGMGGGRGRGNRWRHWYHETGVPGWARFGAAPGWGSRVAPSPEQEMDALKNKAQFLKEHLDAINKRLEELEKGDKA